LLLMALVRGKRSSCMRLRQFERASNRAVQQLVAGQLVYWSTEEDCWTWRISLHVCFDDAAIDLS